ncbi:hypothetical protein H0H93_012741, partial [Arthromyces matolae]
MPSHSPASAVLRLHFATEPPGQIWLWQGWKDTTGITHGIFPKDDEPLPKGLSREDIPILRSFFAKYISLPNETERLRFALGLRGSDSHPGRPIWKTFIGKRAHSWNIHEQVIAELKVHNVHPTNVIRRTHAGKTAYSSEFNPNKDWPVSTTYLAMIVDQVGRSVMGDEAFGPEDIGLLPHNLRIAFQLYMHRSWDSVRRQVNYARKNIEGIRVNAKEVWQSLTNKKEKQPKVFIKSALNHVAKYLNIATAMGHQEAIDEAEKMQAELQAMIEDLGRSAQEKKSKTAKQGESSKASTKSTGAAEATPSEEEVDDMLNLYHDLFEAIPVDSDQRPVAEPIPASQAVMNSHLGGGGDFGVDMESTMTPTQLAAELGFDDRTHLPTDFIPLRH